MSHASDFCADYLAYLSITQIETSFKNNEGPILLDIATFAYWFTKDHLKAFESKPHEQQLNEGSYMLINQCMKEINTIQQTIEFMDDPDAPMNMSEEASKSLYSICKLLNTLRIKHPQCVRECLHILLHVTQVVREIFPAHILISFFLHSDWSLLEIEGETCKCKTEDDHYLNQLLLLLAIKDKLPPPHIETLKQPPLNVQHSTPAVTTVQNGFAATNMDDSDDDDLILESSYWDGYDDNVNKRNASAIRRLSVDDIRALRLTAISNQINLKSDAPLKSISELVRASDTSSDDDQGPPMSPASEFSQNSDSDIENSTENNNPVMQERDKFNVDAIFHTSELPETEPTETVEESIEIIESSLIKNTEAQSTIILDNSAQQQDEESDKSDSDVEAPSVATSDQPIQKQADKLDTDSSTADSLCSLNDSVIRKRIRKKFKGDAQKRAAISKPEANPNKCKLITDFTPEKKQMPDAPNPTKSPITETLLFNVSLIQFDSGDESNVSTKSNTSNPTINQSSPNAKEPIISSPSSNKGSVSTQEVISPSLSGKATKSRHKYESQSPSSKDPKPKRKHMSPSVSRHRSCPSNINQSPSLLGSLAKAPKSSDWLSKEDDVKKKRTCNFSSSEEDSPPKTPKNTARKSFLKDSPNSETKQIEMLKKTSPRKRKLFDKESQNILFLYSPPPLQPEETSPKLKNKDRQSSSSSDGELSKPSTSKGIRSKSVGKKKLVTDSDDDSSKPSTSKGARRRFTHKKRFINSDEDSSGSPIQSPKKKRISVQFDASSDDEDSMDKNDFAIALDTKPQRLEKPKAATNRLKRNDVVGTKWVPRKWSLEDEEKIVRGYYRFGPSWHHILNYYKIERTPQQMYDKWRNINSGGHLTEIESRIKLKRKKQKLAENTPEKKKIK